MVRRFATLDIPITLERVLPTFGRYRERVLPMLGGGEGGKYLNIHKRSHFGWNTAAGGNVAGGNNCFYHKKCIFGWNTAAGGNVAGGTKNFE